MKTKKVRVNTVFGLMTPSVPVVAALVMHLSGAPDVEAQILTLGRLLGAFALFWMAWVMIEDGLEKSAGQGWGPTTGNQEGVSVRTGTAVVSMIVILAGADRTRGRSQAVA